MVTGAPTKLRDRREQLTPMLSQYVDLAAEYDDCLLLFRVGDFYKAFCESAEEIARICELTLIEREDSTGTYAACGIPIDNPATYLERLLEAGYRLAIADQIEDPSETTGLADRAVTRIVTPGTVVDDELLTAGSATYLACVVRGPEATADEWPADASADTAASDDAGGDGTETSRPSDANGPAGTDAADDTTYGLAYVDVSTGECAVTSGDRATVTEELTRIAPAEYLPEPGVEVRPPGEPTRTEYDPAAFGQRAATDRVEAYTAPDRFDQPRRRALGALLAYAEYTQGGRLTHVNRVRSYDPRRSLRLDGAALRGLELFESRAPSGRTLLAELDETRTAMGRRRLESWLRRPSLDAEEIRTRHDAVAALVGSSLVRADVREAFDAAYDLERLVGRVARGRADARDLRSLHATLSIVPTLREAIAGVDALSDLRAELDPLADVREEIDAAVVPDPPTEVTDGGVIRDGYDDQLDEIRATAREGREWVADLQARERERTGIDNLEVGYTQVHGYYIEVTNGQLEKVPDDYTRRQTLKNAERFYTPELKRREDEILSAEERAESAEYELFREVRAAVAGKTERLQSLADAVARLDALAGLAAAAVDRDYCRPELHDGPIAIDGGRHPVVERTESSFVPNDATLPSGSVTVVTGPNMSGKSTYMRQVALTIVLAQAGSFVPADRARLPVIDRLFTRVGASDDIAGGESTFMREMSELTEILHDATPDSLVLLDEVGRGTSTADGRAIARAAVEYLHDELGATTIFATHYHDLTTLADRLDRVRNRHFAATRESGDVTFLHRIRNGAASSSYGIEVAQMAGVPAPVVDRARELVADDERPTDAGDGQATLTELASAADGRATNGAGETDGRATNGSGETDGRATNGAGETDGRATNDAGEADGRATNGAGRTDTADGDPDGTTDGRSDGAVGPSGDEQSASVTDGDYGTARGDESTTDEESTAGEGLTASEEPTASERAVLAELADVEIAETTPMEALQRLNELQTRLGGEP